MVINLAFMIVCFIINNGFSSENSLTIACDISDCSLRPKEIFLNIYLRKKNINN